MIFYIKKIPLSFILFFTALISLIASFYFGIGRVLDDSYITYRYAENFANGYGFRWNINEVPSEGFTSYLHVLLLSFFYKFFGMSPLISTRILSFLSLFFITIICLRWLRESSKLTNKNISYALFSLLVIANPLLIYASLFGLETIIIALVYTVSAILFHAWYKSGKTSTAAYLAIASLIAFLCRPDSLAFFAILYSISLLSKFYFKEKITLSHYAIFAVTLVIAVSIVSIFRYFYFDSYFPNPYFIKNAKTIIDLHGLSYVAQFFIWSSGLYLTTLFFLKNLSREKIILFIASTAFILVFIHFKPLMGTAFRFLIPMWPILSIIVISSLSNSIINGQNKKSKIILILFSFWLVSWLVSSNYHVYQSALSNKNTINYATIGKQLSQLENTNIIATGDQGALPYFSSWNSIDLVGLTDKNIAKMKTPEKIVNYVIQKKPSVILLRRRKHNGKYFIAHSNFPSLGNKLHERMQDTYTECCFILDEDNNQLVFFILNTTKKYSNVYNQLTSAIFIIDQFIKK